MDINVCYDELNKTSNEIYSLASDLENITQELQQISQILELNWTGNDATRYIQSLNEQYIVGLQKLGEIINKNASYLSEIGQIYETFDNNMLLSSKESDNNGNN